jgi:hypothetical protein
MKYQSLYLGRKICSEIILTCQKHSKTKWYPAIPYSTYFVNSSIKSDVFFTNPVCHFFATTQKYFNANI